MKKNRIFIRVTEEEKEELKSRAKKTNKSISDFIRLVALKNNVVFISDQDRDLLKQLKEELRNTANLRNQNAHLRPIIDPLRGTIKKLLKKFS
jgi:uncharacterized protein (DUF1778 family)